MFYLFFVLYGNLVDHPPRKREFFPIFACSILFLWYVCLFLHQIPHCLVTSGVSALISFFKSVLATFGPFFFYLNIKNASNSHKITSGILIFFFLMYWFFRKGERRREGETRETAVGCSTYLCIHWLLLVCALIGDQTCNLGTWGQCSNQLSYSARTLLGFLLRLHWICIVSNHKHDIVIHLYRSFISLHNIWSFFLM